MALDQEAVCKTTEASTHGRTIGSRYRAQRTKSLAHGRLSKYIAGDVSQEGQMQCLFSLTESLIMRIAKSVSQRPGRRTYGDA